MKSWFYLPLHSSSKPNQVLRLKETMVFSILIDRFVLKAMVVFMTQIVQLMEDG